MARPLKPESLRIRLETKVKEQLDKIAVEKQVYVSEIVREAIASYIDKDSE